MGSKQGDVATGSCGLGLALWPRGFTVLASIHVPSSWALQGLARSFRSYVGLLSSAMYNAVYCGII